VTTHDLKVPDDVLALCRRMRDHGHQTWVVGGCLRDMLLGRPVSDWDLATSARPEQVQQVFRKVLPTGIEHGTVTVRFRGESYELTTLRGEGAYSDGRRPDSVHFVDDIEADLSRRDFTFNAIAYAPFEDALIDPWELRACPVATTTLVAGEDGPTVAWETRGQVWLAAVSDLGTRFAPAGQAESRRKNPALAVNARGETLFAWADGPGFRSGGTLHWRLVGPDRQVLAHGDAGASVPESSIPAVVAAPDGTFVLIY